MSWFEEAKKRVEDVRDLEDTSFAAALRQSELLQQIAEVDAPRAFALLERARALVAQKYTMHALDWYPVSDAFLRDLEKGVAATPPEGKEPPR